MVFPVAVARGVVKVMCPLSVVAVVAGDGSTVVDMVSMLEVVVVVGVLVGILLASDVVSVFWMVERDGIISVRVAEGLEAASVEVRSVVMVIELLVSIDE